MTFIHGSDTVVLLDGNDLSTYVTSSELPRKADVHDVTTYGADDHVFQGGLRSSTGKIEGIYDSSLTAGPAAVIKPLIGTSVTFVRRPEGTGSGLPQESVSVVVTGYTDTSPVADMIKWSCDLQGSGAIDDTAQP